jgi:hypothetical protein
MFLLIRLGRGILCMATPGTAYEQQKRRTVADTFCLRSTEIYKCTIMLNEHFDCSSCTQVTTMLELLLFWSDEEDMVLVKRFQHLIASKERKNPWMRGGRQGHQASMMLRQSTRQAEKHIIHTVTPHQVQSKSEDTMIGRTLECFEGSYLSRSTSGPQWDVVYSVRRFIQSRVVNNERKETSRTHGSNTSDTVKETWRENREDVVIRTNMIID